MKLKCRITQQDFELGNIEQSILEKVKYQNSWIGNNIPYPKVLPEILSRQVAAYGNTMNLFHGASTLSKIKQLTRYNPDKFKTSTLDEYFSDKIDNKAFGRAYDFNKSFFTQFRELLTDCYLPPLTILMSENCDYVNGVGMSKNCYLCFSTISCQDCLYCYGAHNCNDCIDCTHSIDSQYCYDCTNISNCYQVFSSFEVHGCQDSIACFNCRQCHDCIGCSNLSFKSYYIFNKEYSKEDYLKRKEELFSNGFISKIIENFYKETDFTACNTIINSEDCQGAYIKNSRNLNYCYNSYDSQDCSFCITAAKSNDCAFGYYYDQDLSFAGAAYQGFNSHFSYSVQQGSNNWYSFCLFNDCNNCFGSIGLKKDSFCILNKQYTKSEYENLLPRIVEHMKADKIWGEFLPTNTAPYSYDNCFLDEWYEPINSQWVDKIGFYRGELPVDNIFQKTEDLKNIAHDKITSATFKCETSGKPYKIISKELSFLLEHKLPLPTVHWKFRTLKRNSLRINLPTLYLR